jgi:hypothetical protein
MKWQFNQVHKENVITNKSYGAVIKESLVCEHGTNKKRRAELYSIVNVIGFDFPTKKIVVNITKGVSSYTADVDVDFLLTCCQIETPDANQEVKAIYVQHVAHNLLDKDTAIFIIVMTLTYLVGMVLGKGL